MTGAIGIFCSQRVPEMLDGIGDHRRSLFEWHRLKNKLGQAFNNLVRNIRQVDLKPACCSCFHVLPDHLRNLAVQTFFLTHSL